MVPLGRVTKFIRQLTHDVRNGLSAIDLESAFIAELVSDPEASDEIRKLRNMVSNTARMLREISLNFQPVTLHKMAWGAATFFGELQGRVQRQFADESGLEIESTLNGEQVDIDLEQMVISVINVLRNAFQFRREGTPVRFTGFVEGEAIVLETVEPKETLESHVPPEMWGVEPMFTTRPGGYGLGLYRTRQIVESHGGKLEIHYRDGALITRIVLPICREREIT